ncbi:MAG TPA: AsmA family protein [Syntrophobacteria bacterium]|nr:AsmA family protein [Syntrophobacteria bacterium]
MRWKTVLAAFLLVVVALAVGVYLYLSTYDYDKLVPGLVKLVKESTGRELGVAGHASFKIALVPEFILRDVSFQNAPWGSRPDLATAKEFTVKLALLPLLRGEFEIRETALVDPDFLIERSPAGRWNLDFDTAEEPAEGVARAFDNLEISRGRVTYRDLRTGKGVTIGVDSLRSLPLHLGGGASLQLQGAVNGQKFTVKGTTGLFGDFLRRGKAWPAELTATAGQTVMRIQGKIADAEDFKGLSFRLAAEGSSLAEAAALADLSSLPDLGPFSVQTEISDTGGLLALQNISLRVGSRNSLAVTVEGAIGDITTFRGLELLFSAQSDKLANLEKLGAPALPFQGGFAASGRISGPVADAYRLQDLKLALGEEELAGTLNIHLQTKRPQIEAHLSSAKFLRGSLTLAATITGISRPVALSALELAWGREDLAEVRLQGSVSDLEVGRGVHLAFAVRGKNLAALEAITGHRIPVRGPFSASGQATDTGAKRYQLSGLEVALAGNHVSGSLDVDLSGQEPRLAANLSSQTLDLGGLLQAAQVEGMEERRFPDLGPLSAAFILSGSAERLRLEGLDLSAGSAKLAKLQVQGGVGDISSWEGIDLQMKAQGNNLADLEQVIGRPLPFQGPYSLSAHLVSPTSKLYRIDGLDLNLGKTKLNGRLDLDLARGEPRLFVVASSPAVNLESLKDVGQGVIGSLRRINDLGPLAVTARLARSGERWAARALSLQAGSDSLVAIVAAGTIQSVGDLRGVSLDVRCQGNEFEKLAKLMGTEISVTGPFTLSGRVVDPEPEVYEIQNLSAAWGESDIEGSLRVNTAGKRPEVMADLAGRRLDLRPFAAEEEAAPPTPAGGKEKRVFSTEPLPLDWLTRIDGSLKLRAGLLLAPRCALENLEIGAALRDGSLEARPVSFGMGGGTGEISLAIRREDQGAAVTLAVKLKDVQVGPMLDLLRQEHNVEGSLDVDVKLTGSGDSPAALMGAATGHVHLIMGNGRIALKYLTVLNSDLQATLLRLLNPFQEQSPFTDFNCFVNRAEIREGQARVRLLLDTEQTTIVAAGDVDLKNEQLDIGIKPSPKSGYGLKGVARVTLGFNELAKPLKLGGTLASPSLAIDPAQAMLTIGKALGGFALFGPFGIITALADLKLGGKDACLKAIEKAQAIQAKSAGSEDDDSKKSGEQPGAEPKKKGGFFRWLFGK